LAETTDAARNERASELVDRLSLWAGASGFIPVPIVDMAAVGGVQLYMLRRLSEIYEIPFSENLGKSILTILAGAVIPATTARQHREGRAHDRNGDWHADDAGGGRRRYMDNRKGFHQAFCFGWNASRLQSTGLSRVHKVAKREVRCPI
jgi:hypothetical protein